jgi:tetratricopeptide (TPR) repeat protein
VTSRARRRSAPPAHGAPATRVARDPPDRIALGACVALGVALYARALWVGFTASDLSVLDDVLHTQLGALLRGGALAGVFAPLSRELYWYGWGRVVQLDVGAFHALNAAIAVAGAWWLWRAVERWAGAGPALLAVLAWTVFPPLGTLLASTAGARELIAVFWCAAAMLAFARGRWVLAGVGCGLAALSGVETWLLPLALLVADALERPADPLPRRGVRLLPSVVAVAVAAVIVSRVIWPIAPKVPPVSVLASFARAWAPEGTLHGLAITWQQTPWLVLLVAALAGLAVPRRLGRVGFAVLGRMAPIGALMAALSLVSIALAPEPLRAERFAIPALGMAVAAAALAVVHPWLVRGLAVGAALASLGAHATIPAPDSRARAFTSIAELRRESAAIQPLLNALRPWCGNLASVPRTFATGLPPDSVFRLVLQRGAPVACRNAGISVRFVAELTPDDAPQPFGVLRFDARRKRFDFEHADARVRALIGEGLLVYARHAPAAACFEAAAAERPQDRELIYPLVLALAAAQRSGDAHARWEAAQRAGLTPAPDSLAQRMLTGYAGADAAAQRQGTTRLVALVLSDPAAGPPHLALGRHLLEIGRARSAALEISVACGIGRRSEDVFWLARAYDALGAPSEALQAYRATLAGGLGPDEYRIARDRLAELLRTLGPNALGTSGPP